MLAIINNIDHNFQKKDYLDINVSYAPSVKENDNLQTSGENVIAVPNSNDYR